MPYPNQAAIDRVRDLLNEAAATLPDTHWRKMFGWPALFSDKGIFALVSETERIGVRLPELLAFEELLIIPGTLLWRLPHEANPVKHWIFVPTSFHSDPDRLAQWVRRAYELSLQQPGKRRK